MGGTSHQVYAASDLSFTAAYNAGPPTTATASLRNDTDSGDPIAIAFPMDAGGETGDNNSAITQGDIGNTIWERIDFQLTASKGGSTLYSSATGDVTFGNHAKFGKSTTQTGFTGTDVDDLASILTYF